MNIGDFKVPATGSLPMQTGNNSFLLERLAADCLPNQFLRELTQNAIEATVEAGGGSILWSYDSEVFDKTGLKKLCIIDDGIGMSPEDMIEHINKLASSSKKQSLDANFGVGAKITAGVHSPSGLIYQSWKEGKQDNQEKAQPKPI